MRRYALFPLAIACLVAGLLAQAARAEPDVRLPRGVKADWSLSRAHREATPTRERICINGLWRWQPAKEGTEKVPARGWGYFKVPGCWPGITSYMQKDSQTVYRHPDWSGENLRNLTAAWYQREITIPKGWAGRRIAVRAEYLNSYAIVCLDGRKVGEMRFPEGEVEITSSCRPGREYTLSLLTVAMPLDAVMLSYNDTASARRVKGSVARRGLCGDVFLISTPPKAHIADVKIDTSVRRGEITITARLEGLARSRSYALRACVSDQGRKVEELQGGRFRRSALEEGRFTFVGVWKPDKIWDLHTPGNTYELELSLLDAGGKALDTFQAVRFGFREFWIDGRDFYLNGTRLFCAAVPLDNAQVGAALATYEGARESLLRLKSFGINLVYTHNYGCQPGSHLGFEEILRAADDVGMLVSLSQPHFGHYDWSAADADESNGYARHAEFYVRVAQNHPSVVMYGMSHNATGYSEDMNPDRIDGIYDERDPWSERNVRRARRAEAIVEHLDPSRIVYHHSSGNLGSMHTSNFYLNMVPVQERTDWFEHWATNGVKPVFLCEYGVPLSWNWTMYRGWYKGKRTFGSAKVPWEFCLAEWNAQYLGDRAYRLTEMEKVNLRWEAEQFRAGQLWHRWDYPYRVGSNPRRFDDRHDVWALYVTDNWRGFRGWELSALSPWSYGVFWKLGEDVDKGLKDLDVDWDRLQRPGFSPDYVEDRYERMDLAFERSDWTPTVAGEALLRNNRPLLAFIAGKPGAFTGKGHDFEPGETVVKQIVIINNSRETVSCDCSWSLDLPRAVKDRREVRLETGRQVRIPVRAVLPDTLKPGRYGLSTKVEFDSGETQEDTFAIHVLPSISPTEPLGKIALFDPKGETAELLKGLGVAFNRVSAKAGLSRYDMLVVGKGALTVEGSAPDLARVREGLKVLVFEQTSDVLEKRLGFRVQEYGLRRVFARVPDHPVLEGLGPENLRDWRGEATLLPPRLEYEQRSGYGPTVTRCGIKVTRPWRCGCRGNVASVLIEKPACGDFLPVVDGGYSLQYSPLMEYREGSGMVLLCQMDVTGRTEVDPAATRLVANMLRYVSEYEPEPRRKVLYAGDPAGLAHLERAGFAPDRYKGRKPMTDQVLVVGPGGGKELAAHKGRIRTGLGSGGRILAVGLGEREANAILPSKVKTVLAEHISAYFEPADMASPLAGIGPADVHNRDPRPMDLVSGGAVVVGDGVLAVAKDGKAVLCQLVPWQFDHQGALNQKRTFRRASSLVARILGNLGAHGSTPLLDRFARPPRSKTPWLEGFYLDEPVEWDDPYRFFRW